DPDAFPFGEAEQPGAPVADFAVDRLALVIPDAHLPIIIRVGRQRLAFVCDMYTFITVDAAGIPHEWSALGERFGRTSHTHLISRLCRTAAIRCHAPAEPRILHIKSQRPGHGFYLQLNDVI